MNLVNKILNSITMYRLVLYGLIIISASAIIFSLLKIIPLDSVSLVKSLTILLVVTFFSNLVLSKIFKAAINAESFAITSFILFLILYPSNLFSDLTTIALAGFVAMLSKYVLTINKKHIFNPAAFALVIIGISGNNLASWWVGSLELLPIVATVGFLIVKKIQRLSLFLSFAATSIFTLSIHSVSSGGNPLSLIVSSLILSLIIFFGTVMLTEPLTTPPTKKLQIIYGGFVGILFGVQAPQLALVIGNIFSYIVSPKYKLFLTLKEKNKIAKDTLEFVFNKARGFNFSAGQYMDWTSPQYTTDSRGNRRYFTIASSPTENDIKIGVKFNSHGSSFKEFLNKMTPGGKVVAGNLSGEFTLPDNKNQKIVFIAGGIGITPMRSMIKYLLDKNEKRDIILFYACKSMDEVAYSDLFEQAKTNGLKTIYLLSDGDIPKKIKAIKGRLNIDVIKRETPGFLDRIFYLSGPELMIRNYKKLLIDLGIKRSRIKTDYFPGY